MNRRLIITAVLITVGLTTLAAQTTNADWQKLGLKTDNAGQEAPDFTIQDLKGNDVTLSDLRGKVVFLNFWATWCPPCRAEMPSMENLYQNLKDEAFEMIAVNLQEQASQVAAFVKDEGYTFPIWSDMTGQAASPYGVRAIPTTYIIDKAGNITAVRVGGMEWDSTAMENLLLKLINS